MRKSHAKVREVIWEMWAYTSLGVRKLSTEWQTCECPINSVIDFRQLVAGFGWNTAWSDNGVEVPSEKPLQFQIRGIRYESRAKELPASSNELVVYRDASSPGNAFSFSGLMGDFGDVTSTQTWEGNPHSGATCIKIVYAAKGKGPMPAITRGLAVGVAECGNTDPRTGANLLSGKTSVAIYRDTSGFRSRRGPMKTARLR